VREVWIYAAALLVLVGVIAREPAPTAVGALVLLTAFVSRLWSRASLARVRYARSLPMRRAFVGESLEVTYSLTNRKALPVPWIEVRDTVPEKAPPEDEPGRPGGGPGTLLMNRSTSLAWYERVRWRHRFRCKARGYFQFGPAVLRASDIFGFFPATAEDNSIEHLTVLPKVLPLRDIGLPPQRPFGESSGGSAMFEDLSRVIGLRDYRSGDPLKRIDWKATARTQKLQSRLYDPAATLTMVIALNVSTLEHPWEGYDPVILERGVTVAASIASFAAEHRYAAGLAVNCTYPNADRHIWLAPSRNPDYHIRLLEALAMVSPFVVEPLEVILHRRAERLPFGSTVVLVAGYLPEGLHAYLTSSRRAGRRWFLVWVGDEKPPELGRHVDVYDASQRLREAERAWQEESGDTSVASATENATPEP
jgi:uncharacterized protein (DUF58 family)